MAKRITFVFFDAGGGHRSAATSLQVIIQRQERPWEVDLLNLQEALDPLDPFLRFSGIRLQDVYNRMLFRGWTLGAEQLLPVLRGIIRLHERRIVNYLQPLWERHCPDVVVSLIPHFNRLLAVSLKAVKPQVPFVMLITDLADFPPHFWIEPQSEFLICAAPGQCSRRKLWGTLLTISFKRQEWS